MEKGETLFFVTPEGGHSNKPNPVDNATLYLLEQDLHHFIQVFIDKEALVSNTPTRISMLTEDKYQAVVWGNAKGNSTVSLVQEGGILNQMLLMPIKDSEGYTQSFNDLFLGKKQLSNNRIERIKILHKTTRVNITVRGLYEESNKMYYFTMESSYSGYDFTGNPLAEEVIFKFSGEFNQYNDFVTKTTYNITSYPDSLSKESYVGKYPTIKLWETESGLNDRLVTSINIAPVIPPSGKTINVLITLEISGQVSTLIHITDWDEIYQWEEW